MSSALTTSQRKRARVGYRAAVLAWLIGLLSIPISIYTVTHQPDIFQLSLLLGTFGLLAISVYSAVFLLWGVKCPQCDFRLLDKLYSSESAVKRKTGLAAWVIRDVYAVTHHKIQCKKCGTVLELS